MLSIEKLTELYNRSIQDDNIYHFERFKKINLDKSYIAGFFDGDGCIYIREQMKHTYTTGFSISQCRTNILNIIKYHYGGTIIPDNRNKQINNNKDTDNNDNNNSDDDSDNSIEENKNTLYNIKQRRNIFCYSNSQPSYRFLLNDIKDTIICKSIQANSLYDFQKYVHHTFEENKEILYQNVRDTNARIIKPNYDISKLNIQYIAGLFDAEGYIHIKKIKKNNHYSGGMYLKLTQKNHPEILYAIRDFMNYGNVCNDIFYHIDTFEKIYDFLNKILPYTIVKYNQILATLTYIESSKLMINKKYNDNVHQIRDLCYKIINKEKHLSEDENMIDFGNQKFIEKEEKEKIEKEEAHKEYIKEIYKQKSENMKGDKNHNYGKEKSIEIKHKMAISHKKNKQSISDEMILQVREDLEKGLRNVDIEEKYNLSRDQVYKIKKGTICISEELTSIEYYENVKNKKCMNKEEQAISKRKVKSDEIIFILEEFLKKKSKTSKDDGPKAILEKVNKKREESNNNKVTIDSVKNVIDNKTIIYQCEVTEEKYTYYQELIQKVKDFKK